MTGGEIAIVGGGCYGTFYARQLTTARERGKAAFDRLLVVDRDPHCRMARELGESDQRRLVVSDWDAFFDAWLDPAARRGADDHIVPSPLMPHLMYTWLLRRARLLWPDRLIETRPLPGRAETPYETATPDGTAYLSHADWLCPVHCTEPARCPVTRAPRTWEMRDTLAEVARRHRLLGPTIFCCQHRVFGVGSFSVTEVMAGAALLEQAGASGAEAELLVGTVSSCHGAASLLHLGAARGQALGGMPIFGADEGPTRSLPGRTP